MNFQQLRFVQAILETGSFTNAAERCFVTQPTLSNAINQLEVELGGELFKRTTKPPSLTELGELLIPDIEATLASRGAMLSKAADYIARDIKSVKLGISPLVSDDYVSTLINRLKSADSELKV